MTLVAKVYKDASSVRHRLRRVRRGHGLRLEKGTRALSGDAVYSGLHGLATLLRQLREVWVLPFHVLE